MTETIVSREIFDTIRAAVEEGVYLPAVESSPAQGSMVLDLALIREFDGNASDIITETLVIDGEFTCESLDEIDWLVVTWKEDDEL